MTDHTNTPNTSGHDTDARIDALARSAGADLRRPAPADGLARVTKAKQRHQAMRAGAAGTAVIALVAIGTMAIRGGDENTVVPATVSTVESPDTTGSTVVASTVPATTDDLVPSSTEPPPDSTPDTTPGTTPPNAAGAPAVLYTSADFVASFGSDISTVDPVTGAVTSTFTVDQAASDAARAAQDALDGRAALAVTRTTSGTAGVTADGQADAGWFTFEYDVAGITYAFDARPSEYPHLDSFSPETLARFDACDQSELRVTGAAADALPDRVSGVTISADGRWMVARFVECPTSGTLTADGIDVDANWTFELFDVARPDLPGRVLLDDVGRAGTTGSVTFGADGEFVAIEDDGLRFFSTATTDEISVVDDGCTARGTKWSRFIGPWIGDTSVALQVTCADRAALVVHDLADGERIEIPVSLADTSSWFVADVDFAHYDRPSNVWYTVCVIDAADDGTSIITCELGIGSDPATPLPGAAVASFLQLGFEYGG